MQTAVDIVYQLVLRWNQLGANFTQNVSGQPHISVCKCPPSVLWEAVPQKELIVKVAL